MIQLRPRWPRWFAAIAVLGMMLGTSLLLVKSQETALASTDTATVPKDMNSSAVHREVHSKDKDNKVHSSNLNVTIRKHSRHNLTMVNKSSSSRIGRSIGPKGIIVPHTTTLGRLTRSGKDRHGRNATALGRGLPLLMNMDKISPRHHLPPSVHQLPLLSIKKGNNDQPPSFLSKHVEASKYQLLKDKICKYLGTFNRNETSNVLRRLKEITILGIAAQLIPNKTYYINIALPLYMTQSVLRNATLDDASGVDQKSDAGNGTAVAHNSSRHGNQSIKTDVMQIDISRTKNPMLRAMNLSSNTTTLDADLSSISPSTLRELRKEYMKKYLELRRFVDTVIRQKASGHPQTAGERRPAGGVDTIKPTTLQLRKKPIVQSQPSSHSRLPTDKQEGPVSSSSSSSSLSVPEKGSADFNIFSLISKLFVNGR